MFPPLAYSDNNVARTISFPRRLTPNIARSSRTVGFGEHEFCWACPRASAHGSATTRTPASARNFKGDGRLVHRPDSFTGHCAVSKLSSSTLLGWLAHKRSSEGSARQDRFRRRVSRPASLVFGPGDVDRRGRRLHASGEADNTAFCSMHGSPTLDSYGGRQTTHVPGGNHEAGKVHRPH